MTKPILWKTVILTALLAFLFLSVHAQERKHPRWNSTPNDINNMLKQLKHLTDAHYSMEIKTVGELSTDPDKNPIVYYSGHYNYTFTPAQRHLLREYMLNGGMMVFNTGLGSQPFYRSTRAELEKIFPEVPLQRLSSDHPVFHSYYDLDRVEYSPGVYQTGFKGNEPWIDGMTINCRTVAIVSPFGLAVGWDGGEVLPEYAAYMPESALRMGVNIISYATAMRAWAQNAARSMTFVDSSSRSTDRLSIAQVVYEGEWKTRHAALSVLLQTFHTKTGIPVRFDPKEIPLSDEDIFSSPLLYITGHEYFELGRKELENLREYLLHGGFLMAEACCGRKGFDLAFRRIMRRVLPDYPLRDVPPTDILFQNPNDLRTVGVTPMLEADINRTSMTPRLEGILIDGVFRVVYSPLSMAGGWEMAQSPYARGYHPADALNLGQNILLYALTQ